MLVIVVVKVVVFFLPFACLASFTEETAIQVDRQTLGWD